MSIYEKLAELGIQLPPAAKPAASYVMTTEVGRTLFVSGHIARIAGQPYVGKLGDSLDTATGVKAARSVAVDIISTLHADLGDLSRIERISKLLVLVNSTDSYCDQHLVANGASDLFREVFGEAGQHARSAFGVPQLPFGVCVEIELTAYLKP
ncbi:RidA family protein [Burkholderia sp. PU8-34]